jgi:membrane protease YdiL (CAAX protease family)
MLMRRDWRGEAVMALVVGILTLLIGFGVVFGLITRSMGLAGHADAMFWQLLTGLLALQIPTLALMQGFLLVHQRGWKDGFSLRWEPLAWKFGLGIAVGAVLVGYPIEYGMFQLMEALGREPEPQAAVVFLTTAPGWQRTVIGFLAVLPAAVAEECLFRGVLYSSGRDAGYPRSALILTSVLFGLAHGNMAAFIPLTLFGGALAWAYERTGNLLTCFIAHAGFNAIGLVVAISGFGLDPTT